MIDKILTDLGLSKEESEIYQSLLLRGAQTASEIAKSTVVQRTYVYRIVQGLITKGLVAMDTRGAKTVFVPQSPDHLLVQAEELKVKASDTKKALEGVLPALKDKYLAIEERPVIRYFEGLEGVKRVYMETLAVRKEILAYVRIDHELDALIANWERTYYETRIKSGIQVRAIVPDTPDGRVYRDRDNAELRETRLVPYDRFPIAIEKNIVGDKVVFFSRRDDVMIATVIENKAIAEAERLIFELAWKEAGDSLKQKEA